MPVVASADEENDIEMEQSNAADLPENKTIVLDQTDLSNYGSNLSRGFPAFGGALHGTHSPSNINATSIPLNVADVSVNLEDELDKRDERVSIGSKVRAGAKHGKW